MLTRTKNLISNSGGGRYPFYSCRQIFHLPYLFLKCIVHFCWSAIVAKMTREFEEKCFVLLMDDIPSPKNASFFFYIHHSFSYFSLLLLFFVNIICFFLNSFHANRWNMKQQWRHKSEKTLYTIITAVFSLSVSVFFFFKYTYEYVS